MVIYFCVCDGTIYNAQKLVSDKAFIPQGKRDRRLGKLGG